jgi:hypothetical protein
MLPYLADQGNAGVAGEPCALVIPAGGGWLGRAGGGACVLVLVRSRSKAAVTAQTASAALARFEIFFHRPSAAAAALGSVVLTHARS